jgi:hypothetical protein
MGVDTQLYLNSKWKLNEIKKVIERTQGIKVTVISNHDTSIGYFNFILEKLGRMIHVFSNIHTPIGTATLLSMGADDQSHKIFKDIAKVFGGIFTDNDCDCKAEFIQGNMCEDNVIPYFVKYAIVDKGIRPDDFKALIKTANQWYIDVMEQYIDVMTRELKEENK